MCLIFSGSYSCYISLFLIMRGIQCHFSPIFASLKRLLAVWELLNHGLNFWLITWGKHWVTHGSTGEGNSAVWPEGVEPGCTSPRPHLRADCHWGRISFWRSLPWDPTMWVSFFIYFWVSLSTMIILLVIWPVKCQPNHDTLLIVYLLIVHWQIMALNFCFSECFQF